MAKHEQHDHSPGDARVPFSTDGGPADRHAQTHDVRREELSNPAGPSADRTAEFASDIAPDRSVLELGGHRDQSAPASDDKGLLAELPGLDAAEVDRLLVLQSGARLEQGGTYVDLNDPTRRPFTALGNQQAGGEHRYVAKRDTDYELWNLLVGDDRGVRVERPRSGDKE